MLRCNCTACFERATSKGQPVVTAQCALQCSLPSVPCRWVCSHRSAQCGRTHPEVLGPQWPILPSTRLQSMSASTAIRNYLPGIAQARRRRSMPRRSETTSSTTRSCPRAASSWSALHIAALRCNATQRKAMQCNAMQCNAAPFNATTRHVAARRDCLCALHQAMSDEVAAAADPDLTLPDVHIIAHHAEPMRLKQRKVCACACVCLYACAC